MQLSPLVSSQNPMANSAQGFPSVAKQIVDAGVFSDLGGVSGNRERVSL
jgi:hypothetical protein